MSYSFAGCGFLGIYHIGVASCLKQHVPDITTKAKIVGTSAGALVASCFLSGCGLGECTSFTLRLATKARSTTLGPLHPRFDVYRYLRDGLRHHLPENAHELCSGRLFVSLTRVSDRKNVIVSEFNSKEELIQAVLCSAFVPFYCGLVPPTFRGVRYVDGVLSDNLPVLDDDTITISPFAGESDICPNDNSANFIHVVLANTSMQCTTRNLYRLSRALFPPSPEILSDMCKQGFEDTLNFLQKNNMLSCTRHLSIRSTITPIVSRYSSDSESNDDEESYEEHDEVDCDQDGCEECKRKLQGALLENLPPTVIAAFQAACDSMNSGMLGYISNTRTVRLLSLLATPWTLPADICINYFLRFIEWLPYLPEDVKALSQESLEALKYIIQRIRHKHKKISARFSCQLAITEVTYGDARKPDILSHEDHIVRRDMQPHIKNYNIGFSLGIESRELTNDNLTHCIENVIDRLDIEKIDVTDDVKEKLDMIMSNHSEIGAVDKPASEDVLSLIDEEGHITDSGHREVFDTFEHCLHISNQMESMMEYYYKGENSNNTMTEVVAVTDLVEDHAAS